MKGQIIPCLEAIGTLHVKVEPKVRRLLCRIARFEKLFEFPPPWTVEETEAYFGLALA